MSSGSDARVVAGRYQLRRQLGRGGMGVVWQAWDPELERDVAIKEVLLPEELTDDERQEMHFRTRREARSAAKLSHPSIITIHDVLDFEDHPWIVMELVNGTTLDQVLKDQGPLPPDRVAAIAHALLDALQMAHRQHVIHRDIKPGNVMLAEGGRVILTDFGIATIDGETTITRTGTLVGSPEFMAPERLQQENSDTPSDLWSLGVTMYAATEGQSPFKRDTVTAAISAVMSAPVPPPQRAGPLTPIMLSMLDRDPARRLAAPQAAQLLASSAPAPAMGTPSGANPTLAASGPTPPAGATSHQPPGAPNGATRAGTSAAGGSNKRKVYVVAGAIVAALLVGAAVTVWAVTRPAEYQLYVTGDYSFEYPTDWEVSEDGDGRTTVSHPDSREEITFEVDNYEPDESDPVDEIETKADGDWGTTDEKGYELEERKHVHGGYLPDHVTAAQWVYRYVNDEQENSDRYTMRYQMHAEYDSGSLAAVWLDWDLPERQSGEYQDIIGDVNRSLRPAYEEYGF